MKAAAGATVSIQDFVNKSKAESSRRAVTLKDYNWELEASEEPLLNIFSCGWMEDGRLGYTADNPAFVQACPRPIKTLRVVKNTRKTFIRKDEPEYVCQQVSAGSRHSLFIMVDCRAATESHKEQNYKKVMITGLNQQGLCEEPGFLTPVDVRWCDADEFPVRVHAGYGFSFVVSQFGNVYSWGNGRYGVLGHGDCISNQIPRQIMALNRQRIKAISTGLFHAAAINNLGTLYTWGRNHFGQLGLGFESDMELTPTVVSGFSDRETVIEISCGQNHCLALVTVVSVDGAKKRNIVYAWGEESKGQLGSGDRKFRNRPQENRWLTKYLKDKDLRIIAIAAGGYHNLALTDGAGQVISWGGCDYGQLGHGFLWDDPKPRLINDLKDVRFIAAGLRHSLAICSGVVNDVYAWGYNGYGELGMGDVEIRLQPTPINALSRGRALMVAAGDRHSLFVTAHRAQRAKEDVKLKPFYAILAVEDNPVMRRYLKRVMTKQDLDPVLLDDPESLLPNQPGMTDDTLEDAKYEKGLRYCMDSFPDPADWRRKVYEICYDVATPIGTLKSVCLACARHCVSKFRLRPYTKLRQAGDHCGCRGSVYCKCTWSRVRAEFDRISGRDCAIGPNQVRDLLLVLREPMPLDREAILDCLIMLAEGDDKATTPRILPVPFETWYRQYFDEYEDVNL